MTNPLTSTRRSLHAVAELVLAGPQYRTSGSIRLLVATGGFRTEAAPDLRVDGVDVVGNGARAAIDGASARGLGRALGVEAGEPTGVYGEGSGVDVDEPLPVDPDAAHRILDAFALGDAALRSLAPGETPILWPEHFDVGIRVDDVNYGISPGDGHVAEPYAYVGVDPVPDDPFWNAPFGRAEPMTRFADVAGLVEFFRAGRERARP